jgi:hypothetical protein
MDGYCSYSVFRRLSALGGVQGGSQHASTKNWGPSNGPEKNMAILSKMAKIILIKYEYFMESTFISKTEQKVSSGE